MARAIRVTALLLLFVGQAACRQGGSPADTGAAPAKSSPHPCQGMLCSGVCRPAAYGCNVIIRSQMRDRCNAEAAGLGCGPRRGGPDVTICDVGVLNRALVDSPDGCTEEVWEALTREGCAAYLEKNRGKPLDEFDPDQYVYVTRRLEPFDAAGNLVNQPGFDGSVCPGTGPPGGAGRPQARPRRRPR